MLAARARGRWQASSTAGRQNPWTERRELGVPAARGGEHDSPALETGDRGRSGQGLRLDGGGPVAAASWLAWLHGAVAPIRLPTMQRFFCLPRLSAFERDYLMQDLGGPGGAAGWGSRACHWAFQALGDGGCFVVLVDYWASSSRDPKSRPFTASGVPAMSRRHPRYWSLESALLVQYSAEQSFLLGTRPEGGRHWDQPAQPVGGSRAAAQAQAAAQARDQKKMRVAGVRPGEEALLFIWVACVVQSACRRSGCGLHCPP